MLYVDHCPKENKHHKMTEEAMKALTREVSISIGYDISNKD